MGSLIFWTISLTLPSLAKYTYPEGNVCACHEKELSWPEQMLSSVFKYCNHNHYALSSR